MTQPNSNSNLFCALRAAFPGDLDQIAVETTSPQGEPLLYTWRDLDHACARIANLLASLKLPSGSRVAVQVEKSVEAMLLYLATLRAGYVFLPLNTAYQSGEIEYFVGNAEPAVVVCTPGNFGWVSKIAFKAGTQHVFTLGDDRTGSLLDRAAPHADVHQPVDKGVDDLAAILYTSGTTGRSKGAMLTHGNLLSNAVTLKDYWGFQPGDVLIHALPIFHVHGLFVAIHAALLNGSKMIWMAKFDPKAVLAAMPIETFTAWRERTGHTILERYGMSETIMLTSNPYGGDARHGGQSERRGSTVGFPLPGVGLRVVDDAGKALPVGEIGNIQVQGPNVFKGYWRMPEKTKEEFSADGWFKTGDVGKVDERGYVSIVGRSKDLIISGGYNVYPAEIESAINDMPGVAESAVVGVPHPDFGEVGVAVVIAKPGAKLDGDAILAQLKSQLANFKIPKRCFVATELPRNTMGKVQKNLLREQHKGLFA
ncbi:MAG: malonyl-CoA synthase [Acidovorax sp. 17-64-282]|nr:MAG: malonyl-CoA synthase [Acidovorax sp. 17-64-282]